MNPAIWQLAATALMYFAQYAAQRHAAEQQNQLGQYQNPIVYNGNPYQSYR